MVDKSMLAAAGIASLVAAFNPAAAGAQSAYPCTDAGLSPAQYLVQCAAHIEKTIGQGAYPAEIGGSLDEIAKIAEGVKKGAIPESAVARRLVAPMKTIAAHGAGLSPEVADTVASFAKNVERQARGEVSARLDTRGLPPVTLTYK